MSDFFEAANTDTVEQEGPEEMVIRAFSRCSNWPRERLGILGLAQGLRKASDQFEVAMDVLVAKCAALSQYCPTDADLLNVARDIRDECRRANQPDITKEWQREYGEPQPFDWKQIDAEHLKSVKSRERALLSAIRTKYPGELSWAQMAHAARELGYEDYAKAWEKALR